jgi:F-type H+-transporting ATPase subunit b
MLASSNNNIFLVPNATIIIELIAFLLVLYVIGRKVIPFLNAAVEKRQKQISESLEAAEKARQEADETRAQRQVILDEARHQAREIVASANRTADQVRAEGEQRGQQEYDRIVANADAEIALARQRALDEITSRVGALVLSVARQVIQGEIDAQRHRALIDEAVAALRSEVSPGGQGPTAGPGTSDGV